VNASDWEFSNRAVIFGSIFGISFSLYALDPQNATAVLAQWLGVRVGSDAELLARLLFAFAALLLIVAAFIRTWASAYLHAGVVYAAELKTASLVADGPYRCVRNPLYLANVLMVFGLGAMMSRTGCLLAVVAMLVFCYRLILREESELRAAQGGMYERYRNAVPRLWPSLRPQIAAAGAQARWSAGFMAELWDWGIAAAVTAFAITLNSTLFFVILGASIALFWLSSWLLQRKPTKQQS
jgi:protein-S-isoprenylcysteine O-methyltransferase Ste14